MIGINYLTDSWQSVLFYSWDAGGGRRSYIEAMGRAGGRGDHIATQALESIRLHCSGCAWAEAEFIRAPCSGSSWRSELSQQQIVQGRSVSRGNSGRWQWPPIAQDLRQRRGSSVVGLRK